MNRKIVAQTLFNCNCIGRVKKMENRIQQFEKKDNENNSEHMHSHRDPYNNAFKEAYQ